MSGIRARAFQQIQFRDPRPFLIRLRKREVEVAKSDLPPKVKQLRTNSLKPWRELREAALFCYGMAQRIGQIVYLGKSEAQDYDFVTSWVDGDTQHLAHVQLKEVVPKSLNPSASIQRTIDALSKYVDSEDLTVAIHVNQHGHLDLTELVIPSLKIAALWVFGAVSEDQTDWGLWGNFLEKWEGTRFKYPA